MFQREHLPYGVIAAIIAVVVLLSLPAYVLAICFNMIKVCMKLYIVVNYNSQLLTTSYIVSTIITNGMA